MIHAQLCRAGQEVVISRRAAEAVLRGAHVFVPGAPTNPVLLLVWHKSLSACHVVITNVDTLKKIACGNSGTSIATLTKKCALCFSYVIVHCRSDGLQPRFA